MPRNSGLSSSESSKDAKRHFLLGGGPSDSEDEAVDSCLTSTGCAFSIVSTSFSCSQPQAPVSMRHLLFLVRESRHEDSPRKLLKTGSWYLRMRFFETASLISLRKGESSSWAVKWLQHNGHSGCFSLHIANVALCTPRQVDVLFSHMNTEVRDIDSMLQLRYQLLITKWGHDCHVLFDVP